MVREALRLAHLFCQRPRLSWRGALAEGRELDGFASLCDGPRVRGLTRFIERVLPVIVLITAAVGAPVMIFSPQGLPRLRGIERELADVEQENAELRRQVDALRGRVTRLREDPAAVERIARDELGFVRQREVVFQFPKRK